MYLAQFKQNGRPWFVIRQSYREGGVWCSRDLFDLGARPERFLHYPGGNAYYIDPDIEETLTQKGVAVDDVDLETLFWRFLDPRIRRALSVFRERSRRHRSAVRPGPEIQPVHLFDRRRLHYLRFGRMDQGRIGGLPAKFWAPAMGKSRDELEQYFTDQERILALHECKAYVFVIFDLQRFFPGNSVKVLPQVAPGPELDARFVECLCRLNADAGFWAGAERSDSLHDYLVRYLILYFDHDFGSEPDRFMADLLQRILDRKRRHRPQAPAMDLASAGQVLGLAPDQVSRIGRRRLARRYRRLARRHHPDQGGDAATFIRITEAYQQLRQRLKDNNHR